MGFFSGTEAPTRKKWITDFVSYLYKSCTPSGHGDVPNHLQMIKDKQNNSVHLVHVKHECVQPLRCDDKAFWICYSFNFNPLISFLSKTTTTTATH